MWTFFKKNCPKLSFDLCSGRSITAVDPTLCDNIVDHMGFLCANFGYDRNSASYVCLCVMRFMCVCKIVCLSVTLFVCLCVCGFVCWFVCLLLFV